MDIVPFTDDYRDNVFLHAEIMNFASWDSSSTVPGPLLPMEVIDWEFTEDALSATLSPSLFSASDSGESSPPPSMRNSGNMDSDLDCLSLDEISQFNSTDSCLFTYQQEERSTGRDYNMKPVDQDFFIQPEASSFAFTPTDIATEDLTPARVRKLSTEICYHAASKSRPDTSNTITAPTVADHSSLPITITSGHCGKHNRQLRTASRKAKTPRIKHLNQSDDKRSPESPESRARHSHNKVEKQYRNRLNLQFERLLAVLPTLPGQSTAQEDHMPIEGVDKRISKAEVLDMARRRIYELQIEQKQLAEEIGILRHESKSTPADIVS